MDIPTLYPQTNSHFPTSQITFVIKGIMSQYNRYLMSVIDDKCVTY